MFATDGSSEVVGFIGTGLSLVGLQSYIDEFSRTQDVALIVTDQAGVVVAKPGAAPIAIESLHHEPMIAEALGGGSSFREVERDGVSHLTATSPVNSYGWTITAEVPTAQALAARGQIVTVAMVLAALLVLAAGGALVKIHRSLRRDAESMSERERSESFLELIIENIPSTVTVKDAETLEVVRVNRAGLTLLGLDRETLLGKRPVDYLPPDLARRNAARERRIIAAGEPAKVLHGGVQDEVDVGFLDTSKQLLDI